MYMYSMYVPTRWGGGCRLEFVLDSLELAFPASGGGGAARARAVREPGRVVSWRAAAMGDFDKYQDPTSGCLEGSRAGDAEISSPVVFPGQLHFPEQNKKPQLLVSVVGPLKAVARGVATRFYRIHIMQTDTYDNFPSVFYALKSIKN